MKGPGMAKPPEGWIVLVDGKADDDANLHLRTRLEASLIAQECVERAEHNVFIQRVEMRTDGTIAEVERSGGS